MCGDSASDRSPHQGFRVTIVPLARSAGPRRIAMGDASSLDARPFSWRRDNYGTRTVFAHKLHVVVVVVRLHAHRARQAQVAVAGGGGEILIRHGASRLRWSSAVQSDEIDDRSKSRSSGAGSRGVSASRVCRAVDSALRRGDHKKRRRRIRSRVIFSVHWLWLDPPGGIRTPREHEFAAVESQEKPTHGLSTEFPSPGSMVAC